MIGFHRSAPVAVLLRSTVRPLPQAQAASGSGLCPAGRPCPHQQKHLRHWIEHFSLILQPGFGFYLRLVGTEWPSSPPTASARLCGLHRREAFQLGFLPARRLGVGGTISGGTHCQLRHNNRVRPHHTAYAARFGLSACQAGFPGISYRAFCRCDTSPAPGSYSPITHGVEPSNPWDHQPQQNTPRPATAGERASDHYPSSVRSIDATRPLAHRQTARAAAASAHCMHFPPQNEPHHLYNSLCRGRHDAQYGVRTDGFQFIRAGGTSGIFPGTLSGGGRQVTSASSATEWVSYAPMIHQCPQA